MRRSTLGVLVYWIVAVAAILMLSIWAAGVARGSIDDCLDATCRITAKDGGRGSGCVFRRAGGRLYVLTCRHVVGQSAVVDCEFWKQGHKSQVVEGWVVAADVDADAAIVCVEQSALGGVVPSVIPLADKATVVRPGETLTSVGCAHGRWSTGWKGHALGYRGSDLHFTPPPAEGRSGSAIFDAEGRQIVGLLRARTSDDQQGIATSIQSLHRALEHRVQCPDGSCPDQYRLLPYRYNQQQRDLVQNNRIGQLERVWPTLPSTMPVSPTVPMDLAPISGRLDRIAELLEDMRRAETLPPPANAPAADAAAMQAVQQAQTDAAEAREQSSRLREVVDQLVGDRATLQDRFEARLAKVKEELDEDASRVEIAKAYARDLAGEKLSDGSAGLSAGKIVGGALGLSAPLAFGIGLGLWLLSRRIGSKLESGDPLLIQRIIERVSDRVDDLRDRVRDDQSARAARGEK